MIDNPDSPWLPPRAATRRIDVVCWSGDVGALAAALRLNRRQADKLLSLARNRQVASTSPLVVEVQLANSGAVLSAVRRKLERYASGE